MTEPTLDYVEREKDDTIAHYDVFLNNDTFREGLFVAEFVANKSRDFVGDRFVIDLDQCELAGGYDGQHTFKKASEAMLFLETKFLLELFI